jgi:hypothetical protein
VPVDKGVSNANNYNLSSDEKVKQKRRIHSHNISNFKINSTPFTASRKKKCVTEVRLLGK